VSTHLHWDQRAGHQVSEAEELLAFTKEAEAAAGVKDGAAVVCGDLNARPGTAAYKVLRGRFRDAALDGPEASYAESAFTSLKPDVYYFAKPRGRQYDREAWDEWHLQEGRQEVIDYVLYDPGAFDVEAPAVIASADNAGPAKRRKGERAAGKAPYGFWAGGWAMAASPAVDWQERRWDPAWRPERAQEQLQLGIPNRLHGSDHLPVACTLRFKGAPGDGAKADARAGSAAA